MPNPRTKGKRLEYYVRDLLRGYGFQANRTPMSGAIEWMKGDISSKDFPMFIECKNVEKTKFAEWYKKAEDQSGALPPVVVWTRNGDQVYAFLLFSDLLNIITGQMLHHDKLPKPIKPKKLALEETAGLRFSKKKQLFENGRE